MRGGRRAVSVALLDTRQSAGRTVQQVRNGRVRRAGRASHAATHHPTNPTNRLRRLPVCRRQPARQIAQDRHTLRFAAPSTPETSRNGGNLSPEIERCRNYDQKFVRLVAKNGNNVQAMFDLSKESTSCCRHIAVAGVDGVLRSVLTAGALR